MRSFGWKPEGEELKDPRDLFVSPPTDAQVEALPVEVMHEATCGPVWQQGTLNSCTGHISVAAHYHVQIRMGLPGPFQPSRLFNYYYGRVLDLETWPGPMRDDGLTIKNAVRSLAKHGVPPETYWRYSKSKVNDAPSINARNKALRSQALVYMRVQQNIPAMKTALAQGYPICLGVHVFSSFELADLTGAVPVPKPTDEYLGAHAILVTGYRNNWFRFKNSWGTGWGDKGYGWIHMTYLENPELCGDLWQVRLVER